MIQTLKIDLDPDCWDAIIEAAAAVDAPPLRLVGRILEVWARDYLATQAIARGDEP